jgi:hypothetical protein
VERLALVEAGRSSSSHSLPELPHPELVTAEKVKLEIRVLRDVCCGSKALY